MADLAFSVAGVEIERYASAPTLLFKLRVANSMRAVRVQNVLLHCQIRIEPTRRRYAEADHERLRELFGEKHRWDKSVHSMLWVHASVQVPAFDDVTVVEMPVPCSFDFNVAATKYFYGLEGDAVPLTLLFSGTVFYRDEDGRLQMDQISWSKEADFMLPVSLWREMMDHHYPDSAWLRIDRAAFDALAHYKRSQGFTSWEQALHALLAPQPAERVA